MKTRVCNSSTVYEWQRHPPLQFTRRSHGRLPRHSRATAGPAAGENSCAFPDIGRVKRNQELAAADLVNLVLERALVLGCPQPVSTFQRFSVSTFYTL